jgi:hypothetical protein
MSRAVKLSGVVGIVVLAVTLVAVLAVAGLGDDASGDGAADAPPQQAPLAQPQGGVDREDFEAFRDCLADHGVDVPAGAPEGGPPTGFDPGDEANQKALSNCVDELPEGVAPTGGPPGF